MKRRMLLSLGRSFKVTWRMEEQAILHDEDRSVKSLQAVDERT